MFVVPCSNRRRGREPPWLWRRRFLLKAYAFHKPSCPLLQNPGLDFPPLVLLHSFALLRPWLRFVPEGSLAGATWHGRGSSLELPPPESVPTSATPSAMFAFSLPPGVAAVAMLRHFGCICCWELASALKESKAKFDSAGVKLIAVGVGTPDKARILAKRLPFPMDCLYADPDRKSYDVLGLYYGLGRTFFNPASAKVFSRFDSIQKAAKNYTIGATPDDRSSVLQQGGMLVFKGKQLLYARKDEGTGDHAPLDDVFDVCCKVPVS